MAEHRDGGADLVPFDVTGPLPGGTTLLEASAGTGKTFTVGALVTRYVAEGVAELDELLVVTFGRVASQELRERVRAQLVAAERTFAAALAGRPPADPEPLLALLLDVAEEEATRRHRRLRDALAAFDAATIATTHQFCQLVLRSLGVAGDTDAGTTLVDDLDELVTDVVDDVYLRWFGADKEPPPFDRHAALLLAQAAVGDPRAVLAAAAPGDVVGAARVRFAEEVRAEVERRKRRLGILSYDDLLGRLADALADPDAPARARMRRRWRIVLVDEFQDTDPVQWQVLERAFGGHATMVLIGDPKQAIYAFRGGDVITYLTAARRADTRATLGTNWRSDQALVDRLQVVLRGAALGDPAIVVHDVSARHSESRLVGAPHPAPFRLRRVARDGFRLTRSGLISARDARRHIAQDLAADVAELLAAGATFAGRPLVAGDIAVIVAIREHGILVQRALADRGVPAVVAGGGDVFHTAAGEDWLALLTALEAPHRSSLVRAAALTCFFGRTVGELDEGGEELTARIADTLRGWALLIRGRGIAAVMEAAEERGLTERVLGRTGGTRLLTDVRHLGQLLHDVAVRDGLGLPALLEWFRAERRRTAGSTRPRRLDSDAAAVQIVTIHGSKGLQYPVVYLPFGYDNFVRDPDVARFHDTAGDPPRRTLDVTGRGESWTDHAERHRAEELGEELRDLYVALTRAQAQVVAWWAPTSNTETGGLHRLVFGRQPGVRMVPDRQQVGDDEYAARVLGRLEALGGPAAEVSTPADVAVELPTAPAADLVARRFSRTVDTEWRRTSYSGLIRVDEGPVGVESEPEETGTDDEPDAPEEPGETPAAEDGRPPDGRGPISPMAELPAGASFGSLVHAVLEHADPLAPDLTEELLGHVREQLRWWPVDAEAEALAQALVPLHRTPLGPLLPGLTLGDLGKADRLRELDFEFPLGGGDRRRTDRPAATLRHLGPLLRTHLTEDDPLRRYAERIEQPPLGDQPLAGYLSGSIDVVLRAGTGAEQRFVVVDYKTNRLGESALDYTQETMAEAMLHSHYPLQALLYSVVLHRFLRWRLPDYDPWTHLGGVAYLFLRGMCGEETPILDGHPTGVFSWRPSADLVLALSDLLDGSLEVSSSESTGGTR
ncbi:MAG: UvrD-helicase domain-containing protein [Nocardioides sp.]|uniref:UvrD-helicase domain-containing protein n=1 Tax=Nocardioides sp. TaxID=35761 RepID=UPI0039E61423